MKGLECYCGCDLLVYWCQNLSLIHSKRFREPPRVLVGWCTPQESIEASHSVITVGEEAGERTSELVCALVALKDLGRGCYPADCILTQQISIFLCVCLLIVPSHWICSHVALELGLKHRFLVWEEYFFHWPGCHGSVARTGVRCLFPHVVGGLSIVEKGNPAVGLLHLCLPELVG